MNDNSISLYHVNLSNIFITLILIKVFQERLNKLSDIPYKDTGADP